MLGSFFNKIDAEAIDPVEIQELEPGTPVVAIQRGVFGLKCYGRPVRMRFGIVDDDHFIIAQCCKEEVKINGKDEVKKPQFKIERITEAEFLRGRLNLCRCTAFGEGGADALRRAKKRINEDIDPDNFRSYPGDDFVAECIADKTIEQIIGERLKKEKMIGAQLKSKFNTFNLFLQKFVPFKGLNKGLVRLLPNWEQEHHGICIENNFVIHFSSVRMPTGSPPRIKYDSKDRINLKKGSDGGKRGVEVINPENDIKERLLCRNRAVWIFFHHEDWGDYDFFYNNCEHFANFCRTGEHASVQVEKGTAGLVSGKNGEKKLSEKLKAFDTADSWQQEVIKL